MYLLHTNIVSYWKRGDAQVTQRLQAHAPSDLGLSAITLAEILYGIERSPIKQAREARQDSPDHVRAVSVSLQ